MAIYKFLLCAGCLISVLAFAETKMDKKESINGVTVQTGKHDSVRVYQGSITRSLPYGIDTLKTSVTNFKDRCNNSYKDRREYTDKKISCKYHNDNLVETMVYKDIKQTGQAIVENETERYILGRHVYKSGTFSYYELVTVAESKDANNRKVVRVEQKMLNDKQVKEYIKPLFEKESAFTETTGIFTLTEVSPTETTLTYEYNAETDHWILNKEVSVSQVFSSISKSINDLVKTLTKESSLKNRDIASN